MAVTSTQIESVPRGNGELYVVFLFTLTSGDIVRDGPRFLPAATDLNAYAAAVVARVEERIKNEELERCVFDLPWNYVLRNITLSELSAFVRELYRNASRETLARVAARILEWLANGRFTDTQMRNAFNLTVQQWNTLKTKMQTLVDNYNAVQIATGE